LFKRQTRKVGNQIRLARGDASTPWGRIVGWFEVLFVDHGILRLLFWNKRRVSPLMWRGAQPSSWQVRGLARQGIKTIVNLRGERDCATYLYEKEAAEASGIKLVNFTATSREPPSPAVLRGAKQLFETIEYPALMHCKSGADRAGIMSALYLFLHEGKSLEEAKSQLSLRYGHIKQGKTGVLDRFFEAFAEARAATGIEFWDWVDNVYDPVAMKRDFHAGLIGNLIVDRILGRE
jgi:protein tyrosine/serine phosphatase